MSDIGNIPGSSTISTDSPIAQWPIGTKRYFCTSAASGSSSNTGFQDGSPSISVAKPTIAETLAVIPKDLAGRQAIWIIEAGSYSTEDIDLREFIGAKSGIIIRGTVTDATAGSTRFANDANEKICAGFVRTTGTESLGYRVDGAPTVSVFDCVKAVDGTAPALAAEPGLLVKRIRFDSATPTVALRNITGTIVANDTNTITLNDNLPVAPAAGGAGVGDVFYIENCGVTVNQVNIEGCFNGESRTSTGAINAGVTIVGIRAARDGSALRARSTPIVTYCGCETITDGSGTNNMNFASRGQNMAVFCQSNWIDEDGTSRSVGQGVRIQGSGTGHVANSFSVTLSLSNSLIIGRLTATGRLIFIGGVIWQTQDRAVELTDSCEFGLTASTIRPTRIVPAVAGATSGITLLGRSAAQTHIRVQGITFDAATLATDYTVIKATAPNANGMIVDLDNITGAAKGAGFGLDLSAAFNSKIAMGETTALAITAPVGQEIQMAGTDGSATLGPRYTFADVQTRGMIIGDDAGNMIVGSPTLRRVAPAIGQTIAASVGAQFQIVRRTAGGIVLAQANTAANATGVMGVMQSIPGSRTRVVGGGPKIVEFSAAPTVGNNAYLSEATAGLARDTVPAATNQRLCLGAIVADLGGNLGLVVGNMEQHPTLI